MEARNEFVKITDGHGGPSHHNHDAGTNTPQRNYENCAFCRKDRKKCEPDETELFRCKLCVSKNRPCTVRERASTRSYGEPAFAEYFATIIAAQMILSICRNRCLQILDIIYPGPCATFFGQVASFRSRSRTLSDEGLQFLASRLQMQVSALDTVIRKLYDSQLSVWTTIFITELQENISYHPYHPSSSRLEAPTRNAADIAACVQYISEYWRAAIQSEHRYRVGNLEAYRKTEFNIKNLLQSEFFRVAADLDPFIRINRAIPASHIAYLNGDKPAAFDLWKQSRGATDILGRTLDHLAAEEGDTRMMVDMQNFGSPALRNSMTDLRGLPVLAIATCMGHRACFEFLCGLQPQTRLGSSGLLGIDFSLLDLALASGIQYIVEETVRLGFALPPYTMYLVKAIELGRADLAYCLLPFLFKTCWNEQGEIDELIKLARREVRKLLMDGAMARQIGCFDYSRQLEARRGWMEDLISRLENREVMPVTAEEAISSLEALPLPGEAGGWTATA